MSKPNLAHLCSVFEEGPYLEARTQRALPQEAQSFEPTTYVAHVVLLLHYLSATTNITNTATTIAATTTEITTTTIAFDYDDDYKNDFYEFEYSIHIAIHMFHHRP